MIHGRPLRVEHGEVTRSHADAAQQASDLLDHVSAALDLRVAASEVKNPLRFALRFR